MNAMKVSGSCEATDIIYTKENSSGCMQNKSDRLLEQVSLYDLSALSASQASGVTDNSKKNSHKTEGDVIAIIQHPDNIPEQSSENQQLSSKNLYNRFGFPDRSKFNSIHSIVSPKKDSILVSYAKFLKQQKDEERKKANIAKVHPLIQEKLANIKPITENQNHIKKPHINNSINSMDIYDKTFSIFFRAGFNISGDSIDGVVTSLLETLCLQHTEEYCSFFSVFHEYFDHILTYNSIEKIITYLHSEPKATYELFKILNEFYNILTSLVIKYQLCEPLPLISFQQNQPEIFIETIKDILHHTSLHKIYTQMAYPKTTHYKPPTIIAKLEEITMRDTKEMTNSRTHLHSLQAEELTNTLAVEVNEKPKNPTTKVVEVSLSNDPQRKATENMNGQTQTMVSLSTNPEVLDLRVTTTKKLDIISELLLNEPEGEENLSTHKPTFSTDLLPLALDGTLPHEQNYQNSEIIIEQATTNNSTQVKKEDDVSYHFERVKKHSTLRLVELQTECAKRSAQNLKWVISNLHSPDPHVAENARKICQYYQGLPKNTSDSRPMIVTTELTYEIEEYNQKLLFYKSIIITSLIGILVLPSLLYLCVYTPKHTIPPQSYYA